LVWIPKYRKSLLLASIETRLKELFYGRAEEHDFEILAMKLMLDHVYLFDSAAPKWTPEKIVSIFKTITSQIIFEEFPQSEEEVVGQSSLERQVICCECERQSEHRNGQKIYQASPTDVIRLGTSQNALIGRSG
jgi:REP element-mobilizing transposase RayT